MAMNPKVFPNGMPVPFMNELFVIAKDGIAFHIDNIPGLGEVEAKGRMYLSNIRMVFVANNLMDNFHAFDIPLLFVQGEKYNQPLFFCKNISGFINPVVQTNESRAPFHSFKILFKEEGDCETFIPLVFKLIGKVRQRRYQRPREKRPLLAPKSSSNEMTRHAYVDPNDPTRVFLQLQQKQPNPESQLIRHSTYQLQLQLQPAAEWSI